MLLPLCFFLRYKNNHQQYTSAVQLAKQKTDLTGALGLLIAAKSWPTNSPR